MQHDPYLRSISRKALILHVTRGTPGGVGKSTIRGAVLDSIFHRNSAVALTRARQKNQAENKT